MPSTPSTPNGEHAAAKAAKAAADKAAADKAKAKAEGLKALGPVTVAATKAAAGYSAAATKADELQHVLGRTLLDVEDVLNLHPALDLTIAQFCEREVPEVSGPVFGSSPAYRALCAARVLRTAPQFSSLSIDAARAAHRVKDVKGATVKVLKAAKAKADKDGTRVTASLVGEVLSDLYPKDEDRTPGPKAKPKAAKPKAAPNTPTKDAGPVEIPDLAVSATRLKAAHTRVSEILSQDLGSVGIAAGIVKCCEDYGTAATKLAVQDLAAKALKAAKPKAKPRTTRTTRTTK